MFAALRTVPRERQRTSDELRTLADAGNRRFAAPPADALQGATEVIAWAAEAFGHRVAVACSMAADTVLAHLVSSRIPQVDTLFLDTGYHFPETRGLRAELPLAMPVNVVDVLPLQTVAEQDAEYGAKLHDRDPGLCCQLRKVEPLARELKGYEAWFTGVRRDEAPTRATTELVTFDERHGLVKINPLAHWSFDDVIDYAEAHQVPVNPLLAEGYPSIGCAPCTRRVAPGEDPRSGRWAGLSKTECGIHL
nr:phosphoadenylyl-sulfate reductase [Aestuariimicrobium kwangyangense]